jgi:hypothetical protein
LKAWTWHKYNVIPVCILLVFSFFGYANSFHAAFHFDDIRNIVQNPAIKSLDFFLDPTSLQTHVDKKMLMAFKSRYIGYLSFALNYKYGGLNVWGYHMVNFIIHVLNGLLLYALIFFNLNPASFANI